MPTSGSNYNRGIQANMPVHVLLFLIRFLILILTLINELIPWKVYSKSVQDVLHVLCTENEDENQEVRIPCILSPCSRNLENLTALQLVKKFPALY